MCAARCVWICSRLHPIFSSVGSSIRSTMLAPNSVQPSVEISSRLGNNHFRCCVTRKGDARWRFTFSAPGMSRGARALVSHGRRPTERASALPTSERAKSITIRIAAMSRTRKWCCRRNWPRALTWPGRRTVENCGNTLTLRCSASERGDTSEFASKLIGQREVVHTTRSRTHRPGDWLPSTTSSEQLKIEPAIMASEIERLPDPQGFLRLASIPDWRAVRLTPMSETPVSRPRKPVTMATTTLDPSEGRASEPAGPRSKPGAAAPARAASAKAVARRTPIRSRKTPTAAEHAPIQNPADARQLRQ
jgi:hypothetical protein